MDVIPPMEVPINTNQHHLLDLEAIKQMRHVFGIDRNLIIAGIGVARGQATAPLIGSDDAIALGQVRDEGLEIAPITRQSV
jgi:hypothetical protein